MDYSNRNNRRELFIRWYAWSLNYKDCDPAVWLANYLNERYEHNIEQKYWFAWLYGNTYQLPTAWVLMNEFPDYELATFDRLDWWNSNNYKRLRYQVDMKYEKGKLPEKFVCYKSIIGDKLQTTFFNNLLLDNEKSSFDNIWNYTLTNFHRFGRYSVWFYLQQLYSTVNLPISPTSLMLKDYSGSKSHRNGLLLALGQDEKYNERLTSAEYEYLECIAQDILQEMTDRFPNLKFDINAFTMETVLCSFKKIFRPTNGRYLGYYLDRQSEEIIQLEKDSWDGIDWNVLWQARNECLDNRLSSKTVINAGKYPEFINSNKISRMDWLFDDEEELKTGFEAFL